MLLRICDKWHGWRYRLPLWVVLIILVNAVLRYPVNISPSMEPIQTLGIFQSLPQFAGLFLSCMGILFFLLFKDTQHTKEYERIPLICLFALVFVGFWIIKTPYGVGADAFYNLAQVDYFSGAGPIPNMYYFYPVSQHGVHWLFGMAQRVVSLDSFVMAQGFRIATVIAFAGTTYWFCRNALRNPRLAIIATLLIAVVAGTLSPGGSLNRTTFRPDLLGGVIWMVVLAIVFKGNVPLSEKRDKIIAVVLVVLASFIYAGHSLVLGFGLLGLYVFDKVARKPAVPLMVVIVAVSMMIPFIYERAKTYLGSVDMAIPRITENVKGEAEAPRTTLTEVAPQTGQAVREAQTDGGGIHYTLTKSIRATFDAPLPLWARTVRYLRWVFFGFGSILAVVYLARLRRSRDPPRRLAGVALGLIAMSGLLALGSYQGFEYQRYLLYAPILLSPLIIGFFADKWRLSTNVLIVGLFVLVLPSFLSLDTAPIGTEYVYKEELETGEFMKERYGDGEGLQIYSNYPEGFPPAYYYTPRAEQYGTQAIYWTPNKKALEKNLDALVEVYNQCEENCVFVYSDKIVYAWGQVLNIQPDDLVWQGLKGELGEPIFENECVSVYERPEQ